jgi:hypothetical protein
MLTIQQRLRELAKAMASVAESLENIATEAGQTPAYTRAPAPVIPSRPAPVAVRPTPVPRSSTSTVEIPAALLTESPWRELLPASLGLLQADPARTWGQGELLRAAVEASGAALTTLRGLHSGLAARLRDTEWVEQDEDGRLRFSPGGEPSSAPATSSYGQSSYGQSSYGQSYGTSYPASPVSSMTPAQTAEASGIQFSSHISPGDDLAEVIALNEEIDANEPRLAALERTQRTALVAVWAGRGRAIQERWMARPPASPNHARELRSTFGRLGRITRELRCFWIDALDIEWSMDWRVYVAVNAAMARGQPVTVSEQEHRDYWRAALRRLLHPSRRAPPIEVARVVRSAQTVLLPGDELLLAATRRLGAVRPAPSPMAVVPQPVMPQPVAPAESESVEVQPADEAQQQDATAAT